MIFCLHALQGQTYLLSLNLGKEKTLLQRLKIVGAAITFYKSCYLVIGLLLPRCNVI